jgi:hypothetical protein
MAPLFTGLKLGFGRSAEVAGPVPIIAEYIFFAGDSGTLSVPAETTRIQVAGIAAGGGGFSQNAPGGRHISAGGGASANVRGDFFPLGGAAVIYYSVASDTNIEANGAATFIKQTNSGGPDIFRLNGGSTGADSASPPVSGGAGGSVSTPVAGPNAVAGGNGGAGANPAAGSPREGQVVGNFGCAGGGGGGSHDNNNLPGFAGANGGASTIPSDLEVSGGALQSNGVGPAPTTWKFKRGVTPGGSGGAGGAVPTYATAGGSVARAYGGGGGQGAGGPQGGGGGGGGGGAGIGWDDPSSPYHNDYFGGGGGGSGYSNPLSYAFPDAPKRGDGAGGILVIRFRRD